jgi:hypothetical protein
MDITERIVGINSQVFEIKLNLRLKELETPSDRTDTHFSTDIRYAKTSLNAFHCVHDLAI